MNARAAYGGVLGESSDLPPDAGAAHVRLLLEPWAAVRSGLAIDFERVHEPPARGSDSI